MAINNKLLKMINKNNKFKNNKNGFAFSVLSLFLVFLIFGFGSLYLFQNDFTQDSEFRESRISYVNGEIEYFKDSYLKSSLQFSAYNTFNDLSLYLNSTSQFNIIKKNSEKLNELFFEGITTGSFEGNSRTNLDNKNMDYLVKVFTDNFNKNYHGNFTFDILNLTISESQSYFIDIQFLTIYNVKTDDNLSSWNFTDEFIIQIPISKLLDPEFLVRGGKSVPIRSSEFNLPTLNWTHDNFNTTVLEMYTTVFYKPEFDYTIGQSYLKRLLGITKGGFYGVVKSLTFDTDEAYNNIYDNAQKSIQGELFGNTLMLLDFDNLTSNITHILDKSTYKSHILKSINMDCSGFGDVSQENCYFSNKVNIYNSIHSINFTNTFSISTWVNYEILTTDIILIGNPVFNLGIDRVSKKVFFEFENDLGGTSKVFSNSIINESIWKHLVITYSGTNVKFYINGLLDSVTSVPNSNSQLINNQFIGTPTANPINLSLDELAMYSLNLSSDQISKLYIDKIASRVDYVDSIFGKGIKFDGIDDYIEMNNTAELDFGTRDFSVCTWFKTSKLGLGKTYQIFSKSESNPINGNFEIQIDISDKLLAYINNKPMLGITKLKENTNYFSCLTRESGLGKLYLNGVEEISVTSVGSINSINPLVIGKDYFGEEYFNGLIDEIKIYNYSLPIEDIKLNYGNYDSFGKGCCNYITLVNQNALGYNNVGYDNNVSSSSTLFYNYYNEAQWYNITLYESNNFTSPSTSVDYYNLLLDLCVFEVYNYLDYDPEVVYNTPRNYGTSSSLQCKNLISAGYY
jgi:hypothetical protein